MMPLEHSCDINRSTAVGTNGRSQLATLYTGVPCLVLPMNQHTAIENKFSLGRAYDVYFASGQDVKPGDKLVSSGRSFIVKVVQPFETNFAAHVRSMCEQEIS